MARDLGLIDEVLAGLEELDGALPPTTAVAPISPSIRHRVWAIRDRLRAWRKAEKTHPKIACLCGSTRFMAEFEALGKRLAFDGWIVLMPCVWGHSGDTVTDEQKAALDVLHRAKIDLADEVFVVCPQRYIGESTESEIEYAAKAKKRITYVEIEAPRRDCRTCATHTATCNGGRVVEDCPKWSAMPEPRTCGNCACFAVCHTWVREDDTTCGAWTPRTGEGGH